MTDPRQEALNLFKAMRRIHIQSARLAKDLLAGEYRSAFKGRGLEFAEVRAYAEGDDERLVDWNITAKMNAPYVKVFEEERKMPMILAVDVSRSCLFGSTSFPKNRLIAEVAAALAFSAIQNHDSVGLLLFSKNIQKYLPPKSDLTAILRIIYEILSHRPSDSGTNLKEALGFLCKLKPHGGICFLISDFLSNDYEQEAAFLAKKFDLINICIQDPAEEKFPEAGLVYLKDLETMNEGPVDTSNKKTSQNFSRHATLRKQKLQQLTRKINAGFIEIKTDQDFLPPIQRFFKLRLKLF